MAVKLMKVTVSEIGCVDLCKYLRGGSQYLLCGYAHSAGLTKYAASSCWLLKLAL